MTLSPGHSHHARRFLTQSTNGRHDTPEHSPAPQDLNNNTSRRGSLHCHIKSCGTKSCATPTPLSRTWIQTPAFYGTSSGDIRHASATNRRRPHFLFELPPKRCVKIQLLWPSCAQDSLLTQAGRPKCLEIQIMGHPTTSHLVCSTPLGARRVSG